MKIYKIIPMLILSAFSVGAQLTVEDITTDSVNLFVDNKETAKSSRVALGATVLLPGLGHQYIGRSNSALVYFTADILSLFGAIFSEQYSRKLQSDARGYAGQYAFVQPENKNGRYWQMVGSFNSMREYNEAVSLNRMDSDAYEDESYNWYWADESYKDEYNKIRNNSHKFHTATAFFIGAMVLNRIVSFVDIRSSTRHKSIKFAPTVSSTMQSSGISVTASF
ncbi:MAG: hypothetical protein Q4F84_09315 [Fibrobacter sp.]|nr:hypothetical protein [Fibrobacter sp.]